MQVDPWSERAASLPGVPPNAYSCGSQRSLKLLHASFLVQTSTSMTDPWNVEPFSMAMAVCTSSAELKPAAPLPPLPIFTYLQSPACFRCSCSALLRSGLDSFGGKPPIQAVFSGSVLLLPPM